jgi:hypothetical protein
MPGAFVVLSKDGKISTQDHRRLIAAREAGTEIRYRKATPREIEKSFPDKNTTLYDGQSVHIKNNHHIHRRSDEEFRK